MTLFPFFLSLTARLGGRLLQAPADPTAEVRHLLLDSRRVGLSAEALFFALRGPSHDGHCYLPELYAQGVRLFIVEEAAALPGGLAAYSGAGFIAVRSPLAALQAMAAAHRAEFSGPVLAITGSNGKTIVKEWLAQLLGPDEDICRSPRSYNSQVGVPLSVWELNPARHTLGVFEAGISEVGEMAKLAAVIQPTEGIFTTLGTAHDAGFASSWEKLAEKLQLFRGPLFQRLFYCCDQSLVREAVARQQLPGFGWTRRPDQPAEIYFAVDPSPGGSTTLRARYANAGIMASFTLPFADEPSVENALHCLAVLLYRQLEVGEIQRRLTRLHPVAMRLEMKLGRHNSYLLDDTYNNDLAGLALALNALGRQSRPGRRTLILSDVLESGLTSEALYARVAELLPASGVLRLIGVGAEISRHHALFSQVQNAEGHALTTEFYSNTETFLAALAPAEFAHETVLVKGARRFGFERIVGALQAQQHGTVLEVNLDALGHNLRHYRRQLRPGTKLMVMVKAFAYGAGSYEVASLLEFQRADYLAVAYADEGVALREAGISLPIMVMNPAPDSFDTLRRYRLEPEIYSFEMLTGYLASCSLASSNLAAPLSGSLAIPSIHLKLDTGMRRLGFDEADLPRLAALLRQHNAGLPVASLMTHLAATEEPRHDDFTREQLAAFRRMAATLEAALGHAVLKHALNSAGILRFPEAHFDMVRLGIGLYGVDASNRDAEALRPVSQLRTTISQIKMLPAGHTVGYGRRGAAAPHNRRIATLAIGYADGYDRRFGNGVGTVLIHGRPAPLVGSVCMDMCMADVTAIPQAQAGDVALVFGEELSLPELAGRIGTIAYELLTNVSERVKRVFLSE